MRIPVLAVLGRPNVGKSTLFNRLLRKRAAIVHPRAGITRDRKRERFDLDGLPVTLIDTGGILGEVGDGFSTEILHQVRQAIDESDMLLLVVEADGLGGADQELATLARKSGKPVLVVANKCDRPGTDDGEAFRLGFSDVLAVSAEHGTNLQELRRILAERLAALGFKPGTDQELNDNQDLSFALIGRPNTGKSSLLNRLLESERAIVSPIPGTTRDPIRERFDYRGRRCTVVDTAGLRRKSRVREDVEFYSTVRTRRSIEDADVTVLLLEPETLVTDQDKKITDIAVELGKGLVFAINKWDMVDSDKGKALATAVDRIRFQFPELGHVPVLAVSALTGHGVRRLLDTLLAVAANARRSVSTGELNRFVEGQMRSYIPSKNGRQLKIYYAVQTGLGPPRFTFFVNNAKLAGDQYLSYIRNTLRKHYDFSGVPIIVNLRNRKE